MLVRWRRDIDIAQRDRGHPGVRRAAPLESRRVHQVDDRKQVDRLGVDHPIRDQQALGSVVDHDTVRTRSALQAMIWVVLDPLQNEREGRERVRP